ncbi:MAG: NADH-quinone oxidoreductase subunit N [Ignavibacteria bacterium]|nr:NADH-quinone oxidoreductase subunit N [Ignavibacteria bacterium]
MIEEIFLTLPHIILSISIILFLVFDGLWKNKNINFWGSLISLLLCFLSVFISLQYIDFGISSNYKNFVTKGLLSFNGLSYFFDLLFILAAFLSILSSREYQRVRYKELNEFYTLILIATFGMIIISHSNNFITLFLGVETMSLSFYVLAGFFRRSLQSVEAGIKYFLLGAFATGFLVYGIAFLYGTAKSLDFTNFANIVQSGEINKTYLTIGITLVFIGLAFKIAAFPFHQWAPDVYTGAPTTISAFMSTAGKASAVFALLLIARNLNLPFANLEATKSIAFNIQEILSIISAATMLIGNFIALVQKNVKRMLAYSSVAHAGYLLMGIVANNPEGWNAIAFYSLAYLFMQFGAFTILSLCEKEENDFNSLEDYYGFSKKHPFLAGTMSVFMLSLAGIPPFAGFFGKYFLFVSAIKSGYLWLTIVAIISSIISMYYYIGLILAMYFKEFKEGIQPRLGLPFVAVVICLALTIVFGIVPQFILDFTYSLLG